MFNITIPDLDVTSGSIPITWCLDHEGVKDIMERYSFEPSVLIVVAPVNSYSMRKENRYIVPLKDLMTYISFRRPGENKIFAMVFNRDLKELRNKYLTKYDGDYKSNILNYDGDNFADDGDEWSRRCYSLSVIRASLDVDVPLESFAPEPPQWQKDWVLWLVRDKGLDQCDFRRKKLFAFTIQPFVFALGYLVRVLFTLASALCLLDSCTLKYLREPLNTEIFDCTYLFQGKILSLRNKKEQYFSAFESKSLTIKNAIYYVGHIAKIIGGVITLPVVLIVMSSLIFYFGIHLLFIIFQVICFVITGIALGCLVIVVVSKITNRTRKDKKLKEKIKEEKPKIEKPIFTAEDVTFITCNPVNTQRSYVKIEALPVAKRSIRLRFQQLKSKICRPFPG